jgi:8-oxo-dGTP pyrophosphatase MutT (NUDIX family)
MGDGDGWVRCAQGHRHWGRFGAAGLLLAGERGAMLQHRAEWTHEGGTWGVPGGARDSHEDVVTTALREAAEEAAVDASAVAPLGWWREDHGGWSYTTVVAHPRRAVHPYATNAESIEIRWWATEQVGGLPLHHGFAASWPLLSRPPPPLTIVVDSANVVGSRPDGWWRDRLGAARRLRDQLAHVARDGIDAASLPAGVSGGGLVRLLPRVVLVVEGEARPLAGEQVSSAWWDAAVTIHAAVRDGDTAIVGHSEQLQAAGAQTLVVTADRGLRQRLAPGVQVEGPSWLLSRLDTL